MSLRVAVHGQGRDLMMLHGVGANHHVWSSVRRLLNDRHRTLAPDLPGFGKSDPVGSGFELGEVAAALWAGTENRIDGSIDLVGNSLGGAVAIAMAAQRPELIRTLVLSAPAGFNPRGDRLAAAAAALAGPVLTARRILGRRLVSSAMARRLMLAGAVADGSRVEPGVARAMIEAPQRAQRLREAVLAAASADLSQGLAALPMPVGVIWGTRDGVVPLSALERLRTARPDARVEIIAGAAHVPQVERPREYVERLLRLIEKGGSV